MQVIMYSNCAHRKAGMSLPQQRALSGHLSIVGGHAPRTRVQLPPRSARRVPKSVGCSSRPQRRTAITRAQTKAGTEDRKSSIPEKILSLLPSSECVSVLKRMSQLLWKHLWAVVLIYAAKDSLQFILHRVTHRLTNYVAESVFRYPISEEAINAWWLVLDQEFIQQYPGYQVVMALFFLLAMPLNLLLTGWAGASAAFVCVGPTPPTPSTPSTLDPPTPAGTSTPAADPSALPTPATTSASQQLPSSAVPAPSSNSGTAVAPPTATDSSSAASAAPPDSTHTTTASSTSNSTPTTVSSSEGSEGSSGAPATAGPGSTSASSPAAAASRTQSQDTSSNNPSTTTTTTSAEVASPSQTPPKKGWFAPLRTGWREAADTLPMVGAVLGRVWWTESVVAVIGLALQAGMMLVVTVPWLLPIYLSAQLSGITCLFKGDSGLKAINSSAAMMQGRKRVVFWPLLGLILAVRGVDWLKMAVFAAMPQRLWAEAMELPVAAYIAMQALRILVSRLQDLLPIGMYLHILSTQHQAASEEPPATAAAASA